MVVTAKATRTQGSLQLPAFYFMHMFASKLARMHKIKRLAQKVQDVRELLLW